MNVLIPYDGSIYAGIAIDGLHRAGLPPNAQAIVLSVIEEGVPAPTFGMIDTDFASRQIAIAEKWAEEGCDRVTRYFPQWEIQMETRWGNPAEVILDKASAWPADLIVVGTHGRSKLARVFLGSVSMKLVREAPCSVRVGRAGKLEGPIRLLIGNDGSSEAEKAVDEVCSRRWAAGSEARVLAVNELLTPVQTDRVAFGQEPYSEINELERHSLRDVLEKSVEKLRHAGLLVSLMIEEGDPKKALIENARKWDADTIFVGARGLHRVERLLLGSVSAGTVDHAPCSVEVVRHR